MGLEPGHQIGKYELGARLGAGGMGVVYRARDLGLGREVALKFLHAEHTIKPDLLGRFLQEARSAAMIVHPGIVTIYECGQISGTGTADDGLAFIAMEMLAGESLGARLHREGRLPDADVRGLGRQMASALAAAHAAGVVHRDLKPDNLFLVADPTAPGGERVKILDFGIAKLAAAPSSVHTSTELVFGTPRYMSPEQCRSATLIDHRSDIYTLGVILFEMVTGRPVFGGEPGELVAKHQLVAPPRASELAAVRPDLEELIARMLAKEPDARPQSMADVERALAADPASATVAPRGPTSQAPRAPVATTLSGSAAELGAPPAATRRWWPIALVGGVGAAVAAIVLVAMGGGSPPRPAPAPLAAPSADAALPPSPDAAPPLPIDAAVPPPDAARRDHAPPPPPPDASVAPRPPPDAAERTAPPPPPDAAPCEPVHDRVVDPFANDPCKAH